MKTKEKIHFTMSSVSLVLAGLALALILSERSERRTLVEKVSDEAKLDSLRAKLIEWEMEDADFIESLPEELASTLSKYSPASEPLDLAKSIESSSVILVTKSEIIEGRLYQVISHVFRLDAEVEFYYEIGHSYGTSEPMKDFRKKPEGMLHFFSGSPTATVHTSSYVYNGRLGVYSGLPLTAALKLFEQAVAEQSIARPISEDPPPIQP